VQPTTNTGVDSASESVTKPKPFRLGILFVHGLGSQPLGDTLVRWGDALFSVIKRATNGGVTARVESAGLGDGSPDHPTEAVVRLNAGDHTERWLVAEGWWAESFRAPSYRELVSWSVRALPWSLSLHVAQRYWQSAAHGSRGAKGIALAKAVGTLFVALAFSPFFVLLLAITLLLGLIPISRVRSVILSAQSTLTATLGDSLAFVESPVRAALIRTRILRGLENLQKVCDYTVVLAHSQGAAATLDALGGIASPADEKRESSDETFLVRGPVPDTLLTFGAGVNQLVSLKVLSSGLPKTLGINPAYLVISGLLGIGVIVGWLQGAVRTHKVSARNLILSALIWVGVVIITSGGLLVMKRLVTSLGSRSEFMRLNEEQIWIWTSVLMFAGVTLGGLVYADHAGLPVFAVNYLFLALLLLAGATSMILSRDLAHAVTEPVRKPPGLHRWVDLYASEDPVPNGETRIRPQGGANPGIESVPIWNRGSVLTDHTTYWENIDGFVLRVAQVCAETAKSPWKDELATVTPAVDARAAWRVSYLRPARWSICIVWGFLFGLVWTRHKEAIPLPFAIPTWLPDPATSVARFAALAAIISFAIWFTCALVRWPWNRWSRAEQQMVLANKHPQETPWVHLIGMGMVVWSLVMLAALIERQPSSTPKELLGIILGNWSDWLPVALGWSLMSVGLMRWLLAPPEPTAEDITKANSPS